MYRFLLTYDGVVSWNIHCELKTSKVHNAFDAPSGLNVIASPSYTFKVLRTLTLATVGQNHLTQSLFYNQGLAIACNLLTTGLKAEIEQLQGCRRLSVIWLFTLVAAGLTRSCSSLPLASTRKEDPIAQPASPGKHPNYDFYWTQNAFAPL